MTNDIDAHVARARALLGSVKPEGVTAQLADEAALGAMGHEALGAELHAEGRAARAEAQRDIQGALRTRFGARRPRGPATALVFVALFAATVPFALSVGRSVTGDWVLVRTIGAVVTALLLTLPAAIALRGPLSRVTTAPTVLAAGMVGVTSATLLSEGVAPWQQTAAIAATAVAAAAAVVVLIPRLARKEQAREIDLAPLGARREARQRLSRERDRLLAGLGERLRGDNVDIDAVRAVRNRLYDTEQERAKAAPSTPTRAPGVEDPYRIDPDPAALPGAWIIASHVRLPREQRDVDLEDLEAGRTRSFWPSR